MYKISVIVPVYNEEKRVRKCLKNLINQTLKDIEIIMINDGSQDDSLKILKSYEKKYSNIVVVDQINEGQGSARNTGIKKATAPYITFVDADDYIKEDMLEILYSYVKKDTDIVICDLIKKYPNKEVYFNNYYDATNNPVNNYIVSHSGPVGRLYKKDLFIKKNLYFLEKCIYEDLSLVPLIGLYARNVIYVNKAYYYYVIRQGSAMNQLEYNDKLDDIFTVFNYLEDKFKQNKKYSIELEYLFIEHLLYSASLRFISFNKVRKAKINMILSILKEKYPDWKSNKYYQKKSIKFKLVCNLVYYKQFSLLNILNKLR